MTNWAPILSIFGAYAIVNYNNRSINCRMEFQNYNLQLYLEVDLSN